MNFRQIASKLSPRGWAMLGVSAAAAVIFVYFVFNLASAPSYSTLLTGLDPAQTGKITSTLSTQGIGYEIQNNGTALAVDSGKTAQARVALATAGLLGTSSQPGFELFNNQQLGASNFQQQITYQRALEGQLDQTIESIQGVDSAQVQLVLPDPQSELFASATTPATAAVLISGSTELDSSSVQGIAQLVASSVPGLSLSKVTITNADGALLWPTSNSSASGSSGSALAKQNAEAQYDATMAAQVNAMLAQTVGAGKAQVAVNADLNTDQTTADSLTYATKGVPLQSQTSTESLTGGGAAGGVAGTAGNIPTYTASGGTASKYNNTTNTTTWGVNKTVTHNVVAPGKIIQQSVSVLVDKSVPASALPALKAAVASAVGLNTKRGDTLSFGQVAFAKTPTTTPSSGGMTKYMPYAKDGAAALAVIGFAFFISRLLKRREQEDFAGQATWVRELSSPRPLAALEAPEAPEVVQLRTAVNPAKLQIEDLVHREPDRVAQQVRVWMNED